MYYSKRKETGCYAFYNTDIDSQSKNRFVLENDLYKAIENNELKLHYQPRINLKSGRVNCCEALVRWAHPNGKLLSPNAFIPIAEENGLIHKIGEWVLKEACEQTKKWHQQGFNHLMVAVNLSGLQFQSSKIVECVTKTLLKSELSPEYLELEITESTLMTNVDQTLKTLDSFSQMNVKISIDDFGTGYSSLNYLKRFPVNTLKIDQSFVKNVNIDSDNEAIVSAVCSLAHNLKIDIVAEGVETVAELETIRKYQCTEAQGFLFSEALPPEAFSEFLQTNQKEQAIASNS